MDCRTLRKLGCYIGSGIVESTCKAIVSRKVQARGNALATQERGGHRASPGDVQVKLQNRGLMRLPDLTLFVHTPPIPSD